MCLATSNNLLLVLQEAQNCIFSTYSWFSGQLKNDIKTLFSTLHHLSHVIFATATVAAFDCFTILGSTSIVIRRVKQCLLRNWSGSDAATSCDFLRKRLQRAFTCANQLCWTAQQCCHLEFTDFRVLTAGDNCCLTSYSVAKNQP